jgi:hypothetical protein
MEAFPNANYTRPTNIDVFRRTDAPSHTDKTLNDHASTCSDQIIEAFAHAVHRYCAILPPPAPPTSQAGTGMAALKCKGLGRIIQDRRPGGHNFEEDARACIDRLKATIKNGAFLLVCPAATKLSILLV